METIKCEKCACVMSSLSEACPLCGTPTMENQSNECESQPKIEKPSVNSAKYFRRDDVAPLDSLYEAVCKLKETVRLRPNEKNAVFLDSDDFDIIDSRGKTHECLSDWTITNYNVFLQNLQTNNIDIVVYFNIYNDTEDLSKFKSLENFKLYEVDSSGGYVVHCGNDAEMVTYLFSEFITKVWQPQNVDKFCCNCFDTFSMNNIELYIDTEPSILKEIASYNELAIKNDYPQLSYDAEQQVVKGGFPADKKVGGMFSKY